MLGICLGGQLIAAALGAKVTQNPHREIGWFPVEKASTHALIANLPAAFIPFHWHGDTFALPKGAISLFRNPACREQGFVYGDRVLALQFHLEVTGESINELLHHGAADLDSDSPFVQSPETIRLQIERVRSSNTLCFTLLDRFVAGVESTGTSKPFISWSDFEAVDLRVGTVIKAEPFPEARSPAIKLWIDLGDLGVKKSSAQITALYTPETLIGTQVLCVANFPPRQVGPFMSEVLVTGFSRGPGEIVLARPDSPVKNGEKLH